MCASLNPQALIYLSYKWKLPLENFITAGNSGNDKDMLKGKTKGIVAANYSPELEELRKNRSIYFAERPLSEGVLEGIKYHTASMSLTSVTSAIKVAAAMQ